MERLKGRHSVLGWNDSREVIPSKGQKDFRGVILSWDGTNPEESFCPGIERLQGSPSVQGWNDFRGVIHFKMERFQGSRSVLGWNDSRGVILSLDGTTPEQSFHPRTEGLQGCHSVMG